MLRVLLALLVVALLGVWMRMDWLAWLAAAAGLALLLVMRPSKKAPAAPKGEPRDTIYPVIYEDVGEPPLLYPENQQIKIIPEQNPNSTWEMTLGALGNIGSVGLSLITGAGRKKPK